jgi:predicted nucleic acid-binding protein
MPNGMMSCFADTSLLVYTVDPQQPEKRQHAKDFLNRIIDRHTLVVGPQSLNECYRVLTEKRGLMPRSEAQLFVWALARFCTAPYDFAVTQQAWRIQSAHRYGWWDCMLLGSATLAGCDLFLSEDMEHERTVEGLKIVNPFKLDPGLQLSR